MLRNLSLLLAAPAVALAAPAHAGKGDTPEPSTACSQTYGTVVSGAIACAGLFDGNIFGGSKDKVDLQTMGLASLGSSLIVVQGNASATSEVSFGDLSKTTSLQGGDTISFGKTLYGQTIIGAHFGNVAGPAQNMSVLWVFDFGTAGATGIKLNNVQGFSNAVLYSSGVTAVPEPSTWALFTLAFGVIGATMRRRRKGQLPSFA